jgi:hypothetical protein
MPSRPFPADFPPEWPTPTVHDNPPWTQWGPLPNQLFHAFSEASHAEVFLGGQVRIGNQQYYADTASPDRLDRSEGCFVVGSPPERRSDSIDPVPGPVAQCNSGSPRYILCFSLQPPSQYGRFVVCIHDPRALFIRLAKRCWLLWRDRGGMETGPVQYQDGIPISPGLPSNGFASHGIGFRKPARFAPDQEYRAVFHLPTRYLWGKHTDLQSAMQQDAERASPNHTPLSIGPLHDIAHLMPT